MNMNAETKKQTTMKIVIVSGLACIAWMFLVKPAIQNVSDLKETLSSQEQLIQTYQQKVGDVGSADSAEVQIRLGAILSSMSEFVSEGDSGTALHSLINNSANLNGVSIARIESVKDRKISERVAGTDQVVEGVNHLIRVEFEGDYGSVLSFMDDVAHGSVPLKFSSFRLLPTGNESVRVNAEINSVMLTSIPSSDQTGETTDE